LVEINMFLKINKHLIPTNPAEVARLTRKWIGKTTFQSGQ
jgi:hypothetical protein